MLKIAYESLPLCLGIVGSRSFADYPRAARILQNHIDTFVSKLHPDTEIVSGGAVGVDTWAEAAAKRHKLKTTIYLPDKSIASPLRFAVRNNAIVEHVFDKDGAIAAFMDVTDCAGTFMTIRIAGKAAVPTLVFKYKANGTFIKWTD